MTNYYFLTSLFPPLEVGHPPGIPFEELVALLCENLTKEDFGKFAVMRRFVDLENVRAYLQEKPHDPRGNLSGKEIEEALQQKVGLPEYVFTFLNRFDSLEDRLRNYSLLFVKFFAEEIPGSEGFLSRYLAFEREWRLVMVGFRAKVLGRDVSVELQYEDPCDVVVAQILAQKDARNYEPPVGYENLKDLFESYHDDPLAFYKALCEYRFEAIEDLEGGQLFSVDRVLGYLARQMIVRKWQELDQQEGKKIVDSMIKVAG